MKWFLIDAIRNGDMWETELAVGTKEEAIEEMKSAWSCLSEHDKRRREDFYVTYANDTDDGIDVTTMTESVGIKEALI